MTTLFLLVKGVCQSLNELGVVSVTKKWSGQNRTSRTACYGPACHLSVNHSKVKIFSNDAKIMLLGKGSSLAVGHGRGFISIIKSSARVEYLGTALASTTLPSVG